MGVVGHAKGGIGRRVVGYGWDARLGLHVVGTHRNWHLKERMDAVWIDRKARRMNHVGY